MSKPQYSKPTITRQVSGRMNKFGRATMLTPKTNIEGVAVKELVAQFGSPLFVFSQSQISRRYRELAHLLSLHYPRVQLCWSYKTNYLDAVCRVFHAEGAWAEVVSEFEYDKAVRLGVPPSMIIINGPWKPPSLLDKAFRGGSLVNIDHYDELAAAEKQAQALGLSEVPVGIRLNMKISSIPQWGRFGFSLENGQARQAVKRIIAGKRLKLVGLHCHIGTFILDPEAYALQTSKMAHFANELRKEFDISLEYLDIGGGFASPNTLHSQYLPGEVATPSFTQYTDAIVRGLATLDYPPEESPTLFLENGRAMVDEAGSLIASVIGNKQLADGRKATILDAGVNTLFTSFWYKHEIKPAQAVHGVPEQTVFYGPLCMNIDVIRANLLFPPLMVGDQVVIKNVGAYNVTQWMQFISYRPNVVMISPKGEAAVIRQRETLETIVANEAMPHWLEDETS